MHLYDRRCSCTILSISLPGCNDRVRRKGKDDNDERGALLFCPANNNHTSFCCIYLSPLFFCRVNIGIPVPREPFSFGGLYGKKREGRKREETVILLLLLITCMNEPPTHLPPQSTGTKSKYGDMDITGHGCLDFFTNLRKITSKWSYPRTGFSAGARGGTATRGGDGGDRANFNGQM